MALEQALQIDIHIAFIGNEADRTFRQTFGRAHVFDRLAQFHFDRGDEGGEISLLRFVVFRMRLAGLYLVQICLAPKFWATGSAQRNLVSIQFAHRSALIPHVRGTLLPASCPELPSLR